MITCAKCEKIKPDNEICIAVNEYNICYDCAEEVKRLIEMRITIRDLMSGDSIIRLPEGMDKK